MAYECLRRIVKSHPDVEFYFIFDRKYDEKFIFADNVKPVVLFPPARHPFLYIAYFEFAVTRFLRKLKPDLYLSTDAYLSLRSNTKQLAVFHDINFEHFPQDFPKIHLWHYKKFFPKYAKKATRILTVIQKAILILCLSARYILVRIWPGSSLLSIFSRRETIMTYDYLSSERRNGGQNLSRMHTKL